MRTFKRYGALCMSAVWALVVSQPAVAYDASCHLKYPIVLSHHYGARKICQNEAATGVLSCMNTENYAKHCADKRPDGSCGPNGWRVSAEEEALPPRNVNATDPTLTRNMSAYYRYFSIDVVARLRDTCGNKVYLADKPIYASYEVRARSLRNTVLQALAAENAQKVVVIGMSQGVQDARYMASVLPVSDTNAALGSMKSKVAAIVSLVGEDGGAELSGLGLEYIYSGNDNFLDGNHNWADYSDFPAALWSAPTWTKTNLAIDVLSEQCRGDECNLTTDMKYKWYVRAAYDLSPHFMRPSSVQPGLTLNFAELEAYLGVTQTSWQSIIPAASESNNGIQYFNYAARIRNYPSFLGWGLPDYVTYQAISTIAGDNDAYVSVNRQKFANTAANFHHMATLKGPIWGYGYHHMFFTGRNEKLYTPAPSAREAAPYNGNAPEFYQQVARDLKSYGF